MTTATTDSRSHLTINEASKASGLSPSVLRIWEVRYGWPAPKRQTNGYRAYTRSQVDELKRASELVKGGLSISSLIIDGLPRWPDSQVVHSTGPMRLEVTRGVIGNRRDNLIDEMLHALETRRGHRLAEVLQRSIWALRPTDETTMILIPTLVGLAELAEHGRELAEAGDLRELVKERALQLLRKHQVGSASLWVVPANDDSHAMAVVVALLLNQRGRPARYWYGDDDLPTDAGAIIVGDGSCTICSRLGAMVGTIPTLGHPHQPGLVEMAKGEYLPWQATVD